jgi:hypothetical protein
MSSQKKIYCCGQLVKKMRRFVKVVIVAYVIPISFGRGL